MDRFWAKASPASDGSGCLVWHAATDEWGYGRFAFMGRNTRAMRVAWILTHGTIPDGLCVCHACDQPGCVNPAHLFLGTHADNARDMMGKGRRASFTGTRNGRHKISPKQVTEIRQSTLSDAEASAIYGIHRVTIREIRDREIWKHIP